MRYFLFLLLSIFFTVNISAQDAPPDTEIFLLTFSSHGNHAHIGQPTNITNREGYDNQPFFTDDGKILFTSIHDGQADIYAYDIAAKTTVQVTDTKESEYSPVVMADGKNISVVRVESDDKTQRLWQFPLEGGKPSLILKEPKTVGYYAWDDKENIAMFLLPEPFTLNTANIKTGKSKMVDKNIGRNIQKIPNQNAISYVKKEAEDKWVLKKLDMATGAVSDLAEMMAGVEDYAWMPDGSIITGKEGKLYQYALGSNKWQQIADLSNTAVKDFYRLAVSPDGKYIALVAYKGEKP